MLSIADRRGLVRWFKTGAVERLSVENGTIWAEGVVTVRHELTGWIFFCEEISPQTLISVGEIADTACRLWQNPRSRPLVKPIGS